MYITKMNQFTDNQLQSVQLFPSKRSNHPSNLFNSKLFKKNSFHSERPIDSDQNGDENEYSDSFRQMMNKVLNRICKKNNFLKIKNRERFGSLNPAESPQHTDSQIYQTISLDNKIQKTKNGFSKLKIQGIGRTENDSNLLKKNLKPTTYNKTSISFLKNKQFRKSIDMKKAKSMPSYGKIGKEIQTEKQNKSFLSNLERITFNNSFYPKVNEMRNSFDQSCKADKIIPKFQIQENYKKMQEVFKKELEPKHNKIELAKKLLHKKMIERQRHNERHSQSLIEKRKVKVMFRQKEEQKMVFEPWNTQEEIPEEMFKVQKRFPS